MEAAAPIDWARIIQGAVKQHGMIMQFAERLYTFDFASIYQEYADMVKTDPDGLSMLEKQQAMLNAILSEGNNGTV